MNVNNTTVLLWLIFDRVVENLVGVHCKISPFSDFESETTELLSVASSLLVILAS